MSLLIKDMEMPKNCLECVFYRTSSQDYDYCCISSAIPKGYIPADCPLIELPDHGDLIDREYAVGSACSGRIRALPTTEDGEDWIRVEEVRQSLKSVPAVIPAERSEDEL